MEFAFTEEQEMIRDTTAAFLAEVSDSAAAVKCTGRQFMFPRRMAAWAWVTLSWSP